MASSRTRPSVRSAPTGSCGVNVDFAVTPGTVLNVSEGLRVTALLDVPDVQWESA
jgi:hypothetical protein